MPPCGMMPWRGHNCLVNPNGEAWRNEFVYASMQQLMEFETP